MLAGDLRIPGRLGLAALILLLIPCTASARDRAWLAASPEPGPIEAFALLLRGDLLMAGGLADLSRVQELRDAAKGDFLWLRSQGAEHMILDAALLASLDKLWSRTDSKLLDEEDELGPRKKEIQRQREDLAEQRKEIGREEERLFKEGFELLEARTHCRRRDWVCRDEVDRREKENRRWQDELNRRKAELEPHEEALDDREDEIGAAQGRIDARREALRRELEKALLPLLERAISKGAVQEP